MARGRRGGQNRGGGQQGGQQQGRQRGGGGGQIPWTRLTDAQVAEAFARQQQREDAALDRQNQLEDEDRAEQKRKQQRDEHIQDEDREKEANKAGKAVDVRARFQIVVGACDRLSAPRTVRKVKEQLARFSRLATPEEEASFFKVITGIKPTEDEQANTKARVVSLAEAMEIMAGQTDDNKAMEALIDHGYIVG